MSKDIPIVGQLMGGGGIGGIKLPKTPEVPAPPPPAPMPDIGDVAKNKKRQQQAATLFGSGRASTILSDTVGSKLGG